MVSLKAPTMNPGATSPRERATGMRTLMAVTALVIVPGVSMAEEGDKKAPPVLNFKMKGIDGKEVDLANYKGKVVMFVNVASKCGLTPQYKGLEELHEKYAKDGLVVIGVPANEFGKQEPGNDSQIAEFCSATYGVKFPMLSKVVVKGEGQTPLYKYLT